MTAYPLRQLKAGLFKVVAVTTTEIEQEDPTLIGMYVFRDEAGEKHMWSPRPLRYEFAPVQSVAEADHVNFLCPLCFAKNGGPAGTHKVMVTLAGRDVPEEAGSRDATGKPSRWSASGTSIDDLVLTPSIALGVGHPESDRCHWHGFVGSSGIPPGHAG